MNILAPKYLQSYLLPHALSQYSSRPAKKNLLTALPSRSLSFSNAFFLYCINECKKLNANLRYTHSIDEFKIFLTKLIKVKENSTFCVSDHICLKLLTRLWLNFSHLTEYKCKHKFRDTVNLCVLVVLELKQ